MCVRRVIAFCLIAVSSSTANCSEDSAESFLEECEAFRIVCIRYVDDLVGESKAAIQRTEQDLAWIQGDLKSIKAAPVIRTYPQSGRTKDGFYVYRSKEEKAADKSLADQALKDTEKKKEQMAATLATQEQSRRVLERYERITYPPLPIKLRLGAKGIVRSPPKVVQVIDKSNAIVRGYIGLPTDKKDDTQVTVWVSNYSMKGVVDNEPLNMEGVFHVSDTKTYAVPNGTTNTVFVIEPYDVSEVVRLWNKKHGPQNLPPK